MPGCSSCVLYARGRNFDVERFLRRYPLEPDHVWRRPGPPILKERKRRCSGFSIYIGEVDRKASWYTARAVRFLSEWSSALRALRRTSGVRDLRLEFCSYRRTEGIQSDILPAGLLSLAGSLGIDIEWSIYPTKSEYEWILGEKIPSRPTAWAKRVLKNLRVQKAPAKPVQRTGVSRPVRSQFESPWRLARTADGDP
jgi:hypothetical protein